METYQYTVGVTRLLSLPIGAASAVCPSTFLTSCYRTVYHLCTCEYLYQWVFMIPFPFWFFWFSVALHHNPPECVTSSVGDDAYIISSRDSGPCISTMTCCSGDRMVFFWLFRKAKWTGFIGVNILCYFHNRQCGYTWSCSAFTMRYRTLLQLFATGFTMRYHLCCNFVVLAQLVARAHSR